VGLPHNYWFPFTRENHRNDIRASGAQSSPAFVREPEGSGCFKRFFRTLKEQLLWVKDFTTLEGLAAALEEFRQRYNEHWLVGIGCGTGAVQKPLAFPIAGSKEVVEEVGYRAPLFHAADPGRSPTQVLESQLEGLLTRIEVRRPLDQINTAVLWKPWKPPVQPGDLPAKRLTIDVLLSEFLFVDQIVGAEVKFGRSDGNQIADSSPVRRNDGRSTRHPEPVATAAAIEENSLSSGLQPQLKPPIERTGRYPICNESPIRPRQSMFVNPVSEQDTACQG
jgi:hypothetical protein